MSPDIADSSDSPDLADLFAAIDVTWAPAAITRAGGWTIREGQGGGQRVSAATAADGAAALGAAADPAEAEAAMRALGQVPLFMIRAGETALDARLAARGYRLVDPVNIRLGPLAPLAAAPLPPARAFPGWEPLAVQREIWAEGAVGPGRLAVMARVQAPKTSVLGRIDNIPAATAFVAIHARIAMLHALVVRPRCRRRGVAALVCRRAAQWAAGQGATHMAALCTRANLASNALFASLGLEVVGQYHYRKAKEDHPA